jgi:NDP-sugar pyrophosphorylase family protein
LQRELFRDRPAATALSLEKELLPRWLAEERDLRAFIHDGDCVDIGTPERYERAQKTLSAVEGGWVAAATSKDRG